MYGLRRASWSQSFSHYANSLLYPGFSRGFDATSHQISPLPRIRRAYFATAFTSLAAFSMSAATAFGCDT
jgi:hypothetical protein